jgi:hypothetical protein
MGEGGNQLIPENVHTSPTNGSQSPFLGAGRATTEVITRTPGCKNTFANLHVSTFDYKLKINVLPGQ